jgi:hypothetical protein
MAWTGRARPPPSLVSPAPCPRSCCCRSSRTPTRALTWWAGSRGRNLFSAPRTCGARALAPVPPTGWSPRVLSDLLRARELSVPVKS